MPNATPQHLRDCNAVDVLLDSDIDRAPSRSHDWRTPCESRKPSRLALHPDRAHPPAAVAVLAGRHNLLCCGSSFARSGRVQLICARCLVAIMSRRERCLRCGAGNLSWTNWYHVEALAIAGAA